MVSIRSTATIYLLDRGCIWNSARIFMCSDYDHNWIFSALLYIFCNRIDRRIIRKAGEHQKISNENQKDAVENQKELEKCIELHLKIKRFVNQVEKSYAKILWFQGSLVMCATAFSMTLVWFPLNLKSFHLCTNFLRSTIQRYSDTTFVCENLNGILTMILQIYLPCYFGSQMTSASEKLSDSLFHSDWTNQSKNFKMGMKIFMENCKKPMKISTMGVFELSLENFLRVVNTSYSLFAVLKKINTWLLSVN